MKKFFNLITVFIAMLAVFFTVSVFTIGAVNHTGESTHYEKGTTLYYEVNKATGKDDLDAIYLNIGAIHAPVGETVTVTVKYSTSSTGTSFSTFGKALKIENYTGEQNYNWVCVAKGQKLGKSAASMRISISATSTLELNEVVCFKSNGERLTLGYSSSNKEYTRSEVLKGIDKQNSFVEADSSFYNFTNAEAITLASIKNIARGNDYAGTGEYTLASEYNYFANLLMLPSVAMFGESTFALRLPSVIATTVLIGVAFLFIKLLTKNTLASLISTAVFTPSLGVTLARTGGAYAFVACFLLVSAYFAYQFFAKGVYSKAVVKSSLPVFYAGLFSALALAVDTTAIFPVLGVATILAFGWRRQALAKKIELAQGKTDERIIKADYNRKDRVTACFAIVSFFGVYFILALLSTIICYPAIARCYSADISFGSAIWEGISQSFIGGNALSTSSVGSVFGWFVGVSGSIGYLLFSIVGFLSLCSVLALVIYAFVKKQNGKADLRLRRYALVLVGGMLCSLVAGLVKPSVSLAYFSLFGLFYGAVIVTAVYLGVHYFIKRKGNRQ